MKDKSRYDTSGLIESQLEPGSGGRVLKNLLGVKRKREMDRIEGLEQRRALDELIRLGTYRVRSLRAVAQTRFYRFEHDTRAISP